jgi:SNF2 family DNA or RNA helicase
LALYQQANARLHRQGQEKPVIVHRLLVQGGVDQDVAKALEGKDETQAALVEALKARIERWSG